MRRHYQICRVAASDVILLVTTICISDYPKRAHAPPSSASGVRDTPLHFAGLTSPSAARRKESADARRLTASADDFAARRQWRSLSSLSKPPFIDIWRPFFELHAAHIISRHRSPEASASPATIYAIRYHLYFRRYSSARLSSHRHYYFMMLPLRPVLRATLRPPRKSSPIRCCSLHWPLHAVKTACRAMMMRHGDVIAPSMTARAT